MNTEGSRAQLPLTRPLQRQLLHNMAAGATIRFKRSLISLLGFNAATSSQAPRRFLQCEDYGPVGCFVLHLEALKRKRLRIRTIAGR